MNAQFQRAWQSLAEAVTGYWPGLAAFFGLLLAIVVTSHIVMHKRDARAAAAWTGVVWLVPVIGALLYWILGVNRINRHVRLLIESENLQHFDFPPQVQPRPRVSHLNNLAELGNRLTGLPLTSGNRVIAMEAPDAYHEIIRAIDEAEESVYLVTYIFANDRAGHGVTDALSRAVERGVRVRVLIDGMGLLYSFPPILGRLRRQGIVVERFLHSLAPWRMPYINLRNHRKIIVIDRRIGFTGGMNLRAGYLDNPVSIRDVQVRVDGPSVGHLLRSFVADWLFTTGEALDGSYTGDNGSGGVLARGISAGPDADFGKRRLTLLAAVGAAQHEIRIVTPYFVPDQTLMTALQLACMRGVRVELMVPANNNLRFVHWASMHQLIWLLEEGCEIYFSTGPFDHTKIMTVDGYWSMLGSGNWDARSLRLNFEFDLECYDEALALNLNGLIDKRRANARRISIGDLADQPYWRRLRNALASILEPYL